MTDPFPTRRSGRNARAAAGVVLLAALLSPLAIAAPALASAPVVGASAASGASGDVASWTVQPATADGPDPDRVSLRHVVEPGASVVDAIAVTNLGTAPARFDVAPGDGRINPDGAFDVDTASSGGSGGADDAFAPASWITIQGAEAGSVELAAGETRVLPVRIDVPATATPGDHPAGIVVGQGTGGGGVALTHRVGVRVHLQVAGDLAPALEVGDVSARFEASWIPFAPGELVIEYGVHNAGNTRFAAASRADASGPAGLAPTGAAAEAVELLPGDESVRTVRVPSRALVWSSGEVRAEASVLGEDDAPLPAEARAGFGVWAISAADIAAVIFAAALVTGVVLIVRRRRRGAEPAGADAEAAEVAEPEPAEPEPTHAP